VLKNKLCFEIDNRTKQKESLKRETAEAYEKMKLKLQADENYLKPYNAYKTLSYFAGTHAKNISDIIMLDICKDCMKFGISANVNFQELSKWLKKAVNLCLDLDPKHGKMMAVDFLDSYKEYFLYDSTGKGKKFVESLLSGIEVGSISSESSEAQQSPWKNVA
jgi:hypothetical protein